MSSSRVSACTPDSRPVALGGGDRIQRLCPRLSTRRRRAAGATVPAAGWRSWGCRGRGGLMQYFERIPIVFTGACEHLADIGEGSKWLILWNRAIQRAEQWPSD